MIYTAIEDVKLELRKLNKHWDRTTLEGAAFESGILAKPESVVVPPMALVGTAKKSIPGIRDLGLS
jgi:hypothetical protein